MLFFKSKTPYEKEMAAVLKKERRFLENRKNRKESFINRKLAEIVPAKLQGTLDSAFAKAFGADGEAVTTPEELDEALGRAFKTDGPYIIDCKIDKDEFVLPMLPPGGSIEDIIVQK